MAESTFIRPQTSSSPSAREQRHLINTHEALVNFTREFIKRPLDAFVDNWNFWLKLLNCETISVRVLLIFLTFSSVFLGMRAIQLLCFLKPNLNYFREKWYLDFNVVVIFLGLRAIKLLYLLRGKLNYGREQYFDLYGMVFSSFFAGGSRVRL